MCLRKCECFCTACSTDRQRQRFFALLPHNIVRLEEAIAICCLFNGLSEDSYEYFQANSEGLYHPFCDLYRVGLLGAISREPDGGRCFQTFKQPYDFITENESALPASPYYLVHPALDDYIQQLHSEQAYGLFQTVTVGDGQIWEDYFGAFCNLEKCLFNTGDIALQDAVYRLLNEARIVLDSDRKTHLRSVLEASGDLQFLRGESAEAGLDDLNYWLEELVEYGDK